MKEKYRWEVVERIRRDFPNVDSDEHKMKLFNQLYRNLIENEPDFISNCRHDIWFYSGSFGLDSDPYTRRNYHFLCGTEISVDFAYNSYVCLDCGKTIETFNWEEFENSHFVLKDRDDLDFYKYKRFYFRLLLEYSVDDAKDKVILEFNKKKNKKLEKRKDNM